MTLSEQILNSVKSLPPEQQVEVLDFVHFLRQRYDNSTEHRVLAEASAKMAAKVWPDEDFSDWLAAAPPKRADADVNED